MLTLILQQMFLLLLVILLEAMFCQRDINIYSLISHDFGHRAWRMEKSAKVVIQAKLMHNQTRVCFILFIRRDKRIKK